MLKHSLLTYRDYYKNYTRIKKIGFWFEGDVERMQALLDNLGLVKDVDYSFNGHSLIYHVAK